MCTLLLSHLFIPFLPQGGGSFIQVAVVRDGLRLGAWVNGIGAWVVSDLSCVPSRYEILSFI